MYLESDSLGIADIELNLSNKIDGISYIEVMSLLIRPSIAFSISTVICEKLLYLKSNSSSNSAIVIRSSNLSLCVFWSIDLIGDSFFFGKSGVKEPFGRCRFFLAA
eukprot:NODE_90_length_21577_cov_0.697691.p18 type:complete len:106 gc:universal NODE_90_length_21577_cov_0.697691:5819-5502(-)